MPIHLSGPFYFTKCEYKMYGAPSSGSYWCQNITNIKTMFQGKLFHWTIKSIYVASELLRALGIAIAKLPKACT